MATGGIGGAGGARRLSLETLNTSTEEAGRVSGVQQTEEEIRTHSSHRRNEVVLGEYYPTPPTAEQLAYEANTAAFDDQTKSRLDQFFRHFRQKGEAPQLLCKAKPIVALWHHYLQPVIPVENPLYQQGLEVVAQIDAKFNISPRMLTSCCYMELNWLVVTGAVDPETFTKEMLQTIAARQGAGDFTADLMSLAEAKQLLFIFAKYNDRLSNETKAQALPLAQAIAFTSTEKTPKVGGMAKDMLDEAKLELDLDHIEMFRIDMPSLQDLINIYAFEPARDEVDI